LRTPPLLHLAIAVIVIGCQSLEKREFSEGESVQFDERERERTNGALAFEATVSDIFKEMPR
jgi:hypothetical protein